jgi:hypothetical protein
MPQADPLTLMQAPGTTTRFASDKINPSHHLGGIAAHRELISRGEYQDFQSSVLDKICVFLAGSESEAIAYGSADDARGDVRMIKQLQERYFVSDDDVERLRPQVHALLTKHWHSVERVAADLLDKKTLTGAEIDALVAFR